MSPREMACQRCLSPLHILDTAGSISYVHPMGRSGDGHQPVPVPVESLDTVAYHCDFCNSSYPVWTLSVEPIGVVAVQEGKELLQSYGDRWSACAACERLVSAGKIDALVQRAGESMGWQGPQARAGITQLHTAFLRSRLPGRALLTTTAWPAASHSPRDLPKLRDRLAQLYRGEDILPGPLNHPGLRHAAAQGLQRARLYWIDAEFADLACHAAAQLPDVPLEAEDLPCGDGLVVWARPVHGDTVVAASWTSTPAGQQLICYRAVGDGAEAELQYLREQVGWLVPTRVIHATAGSRLVGHGFAAPLRATWLLMAQQVTETVPVELDRATRRAYARQRRAAPDVRLVRIRSRPGSKTRAAGGGGRQPLRHREWVGEHWKQQPYGPGRSRRKLIYIAPYLRGPEDQPIRPSSTVRILGSSRRGSPAAGHLPPDAPPPQAGPDPAP